MVVMGRFVIVSSKFALMDLDCGDKRECISAGWEPAWIDSWLKAKEPYSSTSSETAPRLPHRTLSSFVAALLWMTALRALCNRCCWRSQTETKKLRDRTIASPEVAKNDERVCAKHGLHTYAKLLYIYSCAAALRGPRKFFLHNNRKAAMKLQRLNAIRQLVESSPVTSQDELRRKLRRRGFEVTQATLSRDIHELQLSKGPSGYALPGSNSGRGTSATAVAEDDAPPSIEEMIESFGLRARQAMNQVVLRTVMGGAQPVAAAMDRAGWAEVVGTVAGDDTVLVICADMRRAADVEARLRTMLES